MPDKQQKHILIGGPRNGDIIALGPYISRYETMIPADCLPEEFHAEPFYIGKVMRGEV